MKEKQIRELLGQAELSTTGDKNTLMARHQQYNFVRSAQEFAPNRLFLRWTMVYNANQDKSMNQRQDVEQLRKELKRWEGEGKTKKVDIGDADEYQVRVRTGILAVSLTPSAQRLHKQDFIELIERARRSRPPASHKEGGPVEDPEAVEPMGPIEVD
jgi:hypothetical protein